MTIFRFAVLALLSGLIGVTPAAASGPWTTFLRAYSYSDLAADSTSIWCATREYDPDGAAFFGPAGLQRFDRATATFEYLVREPGGLASNRLSSLAIDRTGRLWVGTVDAGLSFLSPDRSRWGLLSEFDGLPTDTVNVVEAYGDTLWIGTPRGLTLWNGREITGTLPDGLNPSPFASDHVTGVVQIGDSLFVATLAGIHVSRLSGQLAEWDSVNTGLPARRVEMLVGAGRDLFAMSTDSAWARGDPSRAIVPYRFNGTSWTRVPGIGGVRTVRQDEGVVLLSSSSGVYRWNGTAFQLIAGSPISRTDRTQWIEPVTTADGRGYGANREGIWEQPAGGGAWTLHVPARPPGNNITNLALSGSRLWVNTFSEGVGRFDGDRWRLWPPGPCRAPGCVPDTTFRNASFAFGLEIGRDGRAWVANWGAIGDPINNPGAIERVHDGTDPAQFERTSAWRDSLTVAGVRHTFAVSSTLDSTYGIWFGLDSAERENPSYSPMGIDYYDSGGDWVMTVKPDSSRLKSGRILALTTDRNGRVWVGTTGRGIQYFDWSSTSVTPQFSDVEPGNADIRGIVASGDSVWALGTERLYLHRRDNGRLIDDFAILGAPVDNSGHPLEVALDGTVWTGTGNGVRVYRRDGTTLADFTTGNSPLASDQVRAIRVDRNTGALWIGTVGGLHRYDPSWTPPPPPVVDRLQARVYPNPARITALGIGLRIAGNAGQYTGGIYDLGGRLVHRFTNASEGEVLWNGRDREGRMVRPGVYFAHVRSGSASAVVRVVLLY